MAARVALLIRCSVEEAERVRSDAAHEHRTISGYVINVLERAIRFENRLVGKLTPFQQLNTVLARMPVMGPGNRTALLIRCSQQEADSVRFAARRREATISGFVLHCLRRNWDVNLGRPTPP